jgi:hypothetical protein
MAGCPILAKLGGRILSTRRVYLCLISLSYKYQQKPV